MLRNKFDDKSLKFVLFLTENLWLSMKIFCYIPYQLNLYYTLYIINLCHNLHKNKITYQSKFFKITMIHKTFKISWPITPIKT